ILSDPEMTDQVAEEINANKINAEAAYEEVTNTFITMFEGMEDNPYMQERAADIRDVRKRVIAALLGASLPNPAAINEEVIIVEQHLHASDTAQLHTQHVKPLHPNVRGRTSPSARMARSLGSPAIVGTGTVSEGVADGDMLLVDGIEGR